MRLLSVVVIMILIVPVVLAKGQPSVDQDPDISNTPISDILHTTPSNELQPISEHIQRKTSQR